MFQGSCKIHEKAGKSSDRVLLSNYKEEKGKEVKVIVEQIKAMNKLKLRKEGNDEINETMKKWQGFTRDRKLPKMLLEDFLKKLSQKKEKGNFPK